MLTDAKAAIFGKEIRLSKKVGIEYELSKIFCWNQPDTKFMKEV